MSKKDDFKNFVKTKPELVKHIEDGTMTWQKYYEIYDIYGENEKAWADYTRSAKASIPNIKNISELLKTIDVDSIQKHISTAQKAIGVVQDLATGKTTIPKKGPTSPRPLNKFFED